ncbi:MAG TPA: NAD(P)H-hydrate dehydratase [Sphingomonas sp.]|nr:NAD(P)H-hydrate dehydratase [Sphingomonas sp.]
MADPFPILTAVEMRAVEQGAIETGTSVDTLMERAGAAVAETAWRAEGRIQTLVLCGPGNNGGDAYVAARLLRERGVPVRIAISAPPSTEAAGRAAGGWAGPTEAIAEARSAPLVIDGLFGTGLTRSLEPGLGNCLGRLVTGARRRIAIDLPSGVASDSGALLGPVPSFDLTVALGTLKPAHRLLPSAGLCGRVVIADIGLGPIEAHPAFSITKPSLFGPSHDANKYSRGKLVVIAGSMSGAGLLAAMAGQRSGAGYVELLGGDRSEGPHALVHRTWSNRALEDDRIGAIVVGPGLGLDKAGRAKLDAALGSGKRLLLDADALTLIGKARHDRLAGHVLTPHWGEFVRLFGDSGRDRLAQVRDAAARCNAIILLKGADSIVAHPDGRVAIAPLAPTWLASAGTGDVLAGIIGSLIAGGRSGFDAAQAGLWLHAEAARMAGPALIADDLPNHLPAAIAACL